MFLKISILSLRRLSKRLTSNWLYWPRFQKMTNLSNSQNFSYRYSTNLSMRKSSVAHWTQTSVNRLKNLISWVLKWWNYTTGLERAIHLSWRISSETFKSYLMKLANFWSKKWWKRTNLGWTIWKAKRLSSLMMKLINLFNSLVSEHIKIL